MPPLREMIRTTIPGYDPYRDAGDCTFDEDTAALRCSFFPDLLKFVEGKTAGQPFALEPWLQSVIANTFGWKRPDGTRRYREVFIYLPRKNAKTTLCAGIANLVFFTDAEPGAEIFIAASTRDQANRLFKIQKQMILLEPELAARSKVHRNAILSMDESSSVKAISAEAGAQHGHNVHCAIVDELHVQPNADLWEALETGTVSRTQPLMIGITTADYQRQSLCNDKYKYACQVRDGVITDPYFLPVIYEAKTGDDWQNEKTWAKANPMYGVSVPKEYMERQVAKAKLAPREENTFKRLHLNMITESVNRFFNLEQWDECTNVPQYAPGDKPERAHAEGYANFKSALKDQKCWGGLDLSAALDLTAFSLVFPREDDVLHVLSWAWIPKKAADTYERQYNIPYTLWARLGYVKIIDGDAIDYSVIRSDLRAISDEYNIKDVGIDRWNAMDVIQLLQKDGLDIVAYGQGYVSMSPAFAELERRVVLAGINHGSNPLLRWQAGNTDCRTNETQQIKPVKPQRDTPAKIDSIVSTTMALGRYMVSVGTQLESVYETRGVRSL